jgi:hypothetical protein
VRKIAPIDPLDDISAPPPSRFAKPCGIENCPDVARPGGWRCRAHHRLDVRQWRSQNTTTIKARRRNTAAARDEDKRVADSARAKVAMALKRGKITKGLCVEPRCASAEVTAYIADPTKWREIVWVCRDHRAAVVEGIAERERARVKQDAWKTKREWALFVFETLPPGLQAEIRTLARRNPIFRDRVLEVDSPLYLSKLVSEVEKRISPTAAASGALTTSAENDPHRSAAASEGSAARETR